MSLFSDLIRITDMISSLHMTWEMGVGWKVTLPSFDEAAYRVVDDKSRYHK